MFAQECLQRMVQFARAVAESDQRSRMRPDLGDRPHPRCAEPRRRRIDQIGDQVIDHPPQNFINLPAARERRVLRLHFGVIVAEQRHRQQLLHGDEAGADAVLHVMIVVGDLIGEIRELRLESGLLAVDEAFAEFAEQNRIVVGAMLQNSLAAFEGEVQSVEVRVVILELIDHPQATAGCARSRRNPSCIRSARPAPHVRKAYAPDHAARQIASDSTSLSLSARAMVRAICATSRECVSRVLYRSPS